MRQFKINSLICTGVLAIVSATPVVADQGRVVVAKSGGEFTTITSAISAGCGNPTCLIEVMPGVYNENITMYSGLWIKGAGRGLTIIQGTPGSNVVTAAAGATISNVTIKGGQYGIVHFSTDTMNIFDNEITGNGMGIYSSYSRAVIKGNLIHSNGTGIGTTYNFPARALHIIDNDIINNTVTGVSAYYTNPIIRNNRFSGNPTDIILGNSSPSISHSVYNTINIQAGSTPTGKFNMKNDGTVIAPQ